MPVDKNITVTQEANIIVSTLPKGTLWDCFKEQKTSSGKNTNARDLIITFAQIFNYMRQAQAEVERELNIYRTNKLIDEWESFLGVDPAMFPTAVTIEERIKRLLLKLVGFRAITRPQVISVIEDIFNVDMVIESLTPQTFPYTFPVPFMPSQFIARRYIVVKLPQYIENTPDAPLIESIVKILLPFKGIVLFKYVL